MADKSVGELIAAQSVTPTDLFVLEQNGTAKKLTGQILENWLVSLADGHGGIQSIKKLSTSGLADTYRITLADTTTFDFVVTNGRSITGISKTGTNGLVDTYTISYNNDTTSKFTVTNGAKGNKGDNAYVWIKYASQKPTESSHSMGDIPDDWIGIYSGNASTAPTGWQQYQWFKHKGEKGDTGAPSTLVNKSVTYQVSDSGTIIPSGAWGSSIPVVPQGKYLWTKTEVQFNTGDPIVSYSVTRMGMDGSGSVSSVAGVSPDETGNVTLTAADVGAPTVEELNTLVTTVGGKQPTTNSLGTETNLADGDFIPFYDTSASANKKTLWSNIVVKIRTALFGSANGFLKADGSGVVSAVSTIPVASGGTGATTAAAARANLGALSSANGAVTHENLSVSARCGLVISASAGKNLENSDAGNTYYAGWTSTGSVKTWTLNAELSATISNGFAVAFAELWPDDKTRISISGVRLLHRGEGQLLVKSQSAVLGLVERGNMIALQKMFTDNTNGDVWLITGDVEVVS